MDQVALVESQLNDGWKLVDALVRGGIGVTAACWLKTSADEQWFLYIASPIVDEDSLSKAYQRVHAVIRRMPQPFWVDPFEVKLLSPKHPIAVNAFTAQRRFPVPRPVRYDAPCIGGISVEAGFLYPPVPPELQDSTGTVRNPLHEQPSDH